MQHENLVRIDENAAPSNRRFGLSIGAACWIIAVIRVATGHGHWEWFLAGGFLPILFAIAWPDVLAPFNRLWLRLGLALEKVVNPVVMSLLFVSAIVPIGLVLRLFGKDLLRLRPSPNAGSYWVAREPTGAAIETMKKPF